MEEDLLQITAEESGERIDALLAHMLPQLSRSAAQRLLEEGRVLLRGAPVRKNYRCAAGDCFLLSLPEAEEVPLLPQDIPLDVVYEDGDVIVVNKPRGLVVHPAPGHPDGTLVNALLFHCGDSLSGIGGEKRPGIVHRIDKDTSGLLLIAKNEDAQVVLARQFFEHTIERKYNALVWGNFDEDEGTIIGNLERSPQDRRIMHVTDDPERGKHAVTHWRVLERFGYVTLVECILETGRTHQIRAHMCHIGHPLFNDAAYGGDRILKGTTFSRYKQFVENNFRLLPRQALHALVLGFEHPTTGQHMHFESPIPADMAAVLERWRNYAANSSSVD